MQLSQAEADVFVPDGLDLGPALARTTHMGIGAHQDDLEIMAWPGILASFREAAHWFTGVVVSDGGGSPRTGSYARFTDAEMREVRRKEQRWAAEMGQYGAMLQLGWPSAVLKEPGSYNQAPSAATELVAILEVARPQTLYLHQPADKHPTHIAVLLHSLAALRTLPPEARPQRVLGCEVWRDLDWAPERARLGLPAGGKPELSQRLLQAFDSQISGGKRYDLAAAGRRVAHATFAQPHAVDESDGLLLALDLTPLLQAEPGKTLVQSVRAYTAALLDEFRADVLNLLRD